MTAIAIPANIASLLHSQVCEAVEKIAARLGSNPKNVIRMCAWAVKGGILHMVLPVDAVL